MNSVIVKIRIASAKEVARPTSNTQAGIGKIIMTMIAMSAMASSMVGLKSSLTDSFGTDFFSYLKAIRSRPDDPANVKPAFSVPVVRD
ncbi:hypothetical protein [Tritonibacter horizontis]|uniref:hypothetical protein n=1 Tax=Tritonibacter horizontis TaxID=1768241 RepID=UPI001E53EE1A|nr:hypothetical protein [Tritonibacter horizontis]